MTTNIRVATILSVKTDYIELWEKNMAYEQSSSSARLSVNT